MAAFKPKVHSETDDNDAKTGLKAAQDARVQRIHLNLSIRLEHISEGVCVCVCVSQSQTDRDDGAMDVI